jgi:hypothetical protein
MIKNICCSKYDNNYKKVFLPQILGLKKLLEELIYENQ